MIRISGRIFSLGILISLGLISLSSCSVTKRVYNKGFYIDWNHSSKKNSKKDKAQVENDEREITKLKGATTYSIKDSLKTSSYKMANVFEVPVNKEVERNQVTLKRFKSTGVIQNAVPTPINFKNHTFFKNDAKLRSAEKSPSSTIGTILIILGISLCIGSLILIFGYPTLENLFQALVFSGNGFVVGLLGFILFLLIAATIALIVFLVELMGGAVIGFVVGGLFIIMGAIMREVAGE
jgi:hypothetical protein